MDEFFAKLVGEFEAKTDRLVQLAALANRKRAGRRDQIAYEKFRLEVLELDSRIRALRARTPNIHLEFD